MGREVVHDYVEFVIVYVPQISQKLDKLLPSLSCFHVSVELFFLQVIGCQKMLHTLSSVICCRQTIWFAFGTSIGTSDWPDF